MRLHRTLPLLGLVLLASAACTQSLTGPEALVASLEISDVEVSFGDRIEVSLVLDNPAASDVVFSTPMGCLALPVVYRGDAAVGWQGTPVPCTAAAATWVVPAGGVLEVDFDLGVAEPRSTFPFEYDLAPEPGGYEIRMETLFEPFEELMIEVAVVQS